MEKVTPIFILSGPQGIGKSRHAAHLAEALGCISITDEWNGSDHLPLGTLAITNREWCPRMPGGVIFQITDPAGLEALIRAFQPQAS